MFKYGGRAHRRTADSNQKQASDQTEILEKVPEVASTVTRPGPEVRIFPERVIQECRDRAKARKDECGETIVPANDDANRRDEFNNDGDHE